MKEPKTYIINMGAEAGFWGRPKEKIWDAEITLVSKEDYDFLQAENARLREALEFYADKSQMFDCAHDAHGTTIGYIPDISDFDRENGRDIPHLGKRAREALKGAT